MVPFQHKYGYIRQRKLESGLSLSEDAKRADSATATVSEPQPPCDLPSNFCAAVCARRQKWDAVKDSADEEVTKYLSDTSIERSSLDAYPMIKQLYVRLNSEHYIAGCRCCC